MMASGNSFRPCFLPDLRAGYRENITGLGHEYDNQPVCQAGC